MNRSNKIKAIALSLFLPMLGMSENETAANSSTYFSNHLFIALLVAIILLLIIIVAFSTVLKNVAEGDFLNKKIQMDNEQNSSSGRIVSTIVFCLMSFSIMAKTNKADDSRIGGLDNFTFYFMLVVIFIEILVLGLLIFQFKFLLKSKAQKTVVSRRAESALLQSLTDVVPIEDEESILLDHNYDGIRELDNNLPPWWKYGFYLTIIVAVIYLVHYHVTGTGDLQIAEYNKEMEQARLDVEEYMKTSANKVDENSVAFLKDAKELAAGKEAFMPVCAACHGRSGEGGVGPNLTDEYWLHGGSIQDIFKSIKYGWVEKGMKSWKEDLSPMQIAQISSFIISLKGTKPANGKAPQGDLYVEKEKMPADTTKFKSDSLKVEMPDSAKADK